MMDDEPERMDPRCDAGGRGYMLWMECCNDGEYVRATDYDALAAKLAKVEAERDAFASNIPDAAQNLIRNAQTGRLKALHRVKALVEAGKAVIDRWDSPQWRDLRHMGESIDELRAVLSALEKNK